MGRISRLVLVAAAATGAVWVAPVGGPASAAPLPVAGSLTVGSASVAVGGTIQVTLDGCDAAAIASSGDDAMPTAYLIVGSGAAATRAAVARANASNDPVTVDLVVPGWVDPADPAVVAGGCDALFFTASPGVNVERRFAFPEAVVDVTPAAGSVATPTASVPRSTFEGAQEVSISGSGCQPGAAVRVDLEPGTDLAWRSGPPTGFSWVAPVQAPVVGADGTFDTWIQLNDLDSKYDPGGPGSGAGPLPEGDYVLRVRCGEVEARPHTIEIDGTNPSGSVAVQLSAAFVQSSVVSGTGCDGGRSVTVSYRGEHYGGTDAPVATLSAEVAADGSWSLLLAGSGLVDEARYLYAACGDPAGSGFAYVVRRAVFPVTSGLVVDRIAPAADAPAGSDVAITVSGRCDGPVDAVVYEPRTREVLAASGAVRGTGGEQTHRLNLTLPTRTGTFAVAGRCLLAVGEEVQVDVTAPSGAPPATPVPGDADYTG